MPQGSETMKTNDIIDGIDILEESVRSLDAALLDILLYDRTTRKSIIWATTDYESIGIEYGENEEITADLITGHYANLIQPRVQKSANAQAGRTRCKAEVFTPSWVCNTQNNLVDAQWFGIPDLFNVTDGQSWTATTTPIPFTDETKSWKKYVDAQRLEVSCGEAPYLVSRYDTVTGKAIPLKERIGLLDRKLRVVEENTSSPAEWLKWSQRAFESVYGYEYQGDNLLLARENLLYTYVEYYYSHFSEAPDIEQLKKIARIISWNIWQMDGVKLVVPGSCKPEEYHQFSLFDFIDQDAGVPTSETIYVCPGCLKGDVTKHTGIYCRIMDWRTKGSVPFLSMIGGGKKHGDI